MLPVPRYFSAIAILPFVVYCAGTGQSQVLGLEFGLRGTMIDSRNSKIGFTAPPADGLVVLFWSHSRSGYPPFG